MILSRPVSAVPASLLSMYEGMGWWCQYKMNGTYSQVTVEDGAVTDARNRHDERHRAWRLTDESARVWRRVPRGKWVFVAELMHSKVPGIRDTHYIHDVVSRGQTLVGTTYEKRWEMLREVFDSLIEAEATSHWVLDANAWLAKCYTPGSDYRKMFASLGRPEHEGLVVKDPGGILTTRGSDWSVKCRRPTKNFSA